MKHYNFFVIYIEIIDSNHIILFFQIWCYRIIKLKEKNLSRKLQKYTNSQPNHRLKIYYSEIMNSFQKYFF